MTIETLSSSAGPRVTRRRFLAASGGLSFAIVLGANGAGLLTPARAKSVAQGITAWVRIAPDDVITILTPGAEMGQGSMTSIPLILAEELDADWDKVVLEWAPADPEIYGYIRQRRDAEDDSQGFTVDNHALERGDICAGGHHVILIPNVPFQLGWVNVARGRHVVGPRRCCCKG